MSSNIFSAPFSLLLLGPLHCEHEYAWHCPRGLLNCPHFLLLFCSASVMSNTLFSSSLICSSVSLNLLLIPSNIVLFQLLYFQLFGSSLCFFNSNHFSLCSSILLPCSLITTLNSLSGRLSISTLLICSPGVLPYSVAPFYFFLFLFCLCCPSHNILLCCPILPNLIFLFLVFSFRAAPVAYGSSRVRGWIRATAAGLHHSHSNARSKPSLRPAPQLTTLSDC